MRISRLAKMRGQGMKYRLLAIDLDGTLLDSSGRISDANRAAVRRARDAGVLVALCTGRGLTESRGVISALEHPGPIVLAGGAHVADPATGRTLHRAIVEPKLAGELIEHLAARSHAVVALLDPEPWNHDYLVVGAERLTANTRWWFETIGARIRAVDRPTEQDLHHILRVGIVGPSAVMPSVQRSVEERFATRVMVQYFTAVRQSDEDVQVLEIFAGGVNKWAGLVWLAAEHGIALNQTAAIGDQINDISMIAEAACGVAMGNAIPAVVEAADYVTTSNDQDGVARAIDHLLAGRW
jgi:5-amino-6-(5-phospho-D-ribitylamino)uracil phosphatase